MNKLSKSAVALIILAAAAIALGVVLFFSMPEAWTESFGPGHWMEKGAAYQHMFDGAAGVPGVRGRGFRGTHGGFPFGIVLVVGLFIFLVSRRRGGYWSRHNHGRAILDQMYTEEKISEEEYRRKRTVIEEEE